ncbi:MAG: DNA gyrase subunit A, partial [Flavobacteriales bacterium]|nr:DNA gyrase subunit A [Flavobacteriales bacterium]
IGMIAVDADNLGERQVLVVSEKGYGKRSLIQDEDGEYVYRMVNRGGKGVKTMQVTDKTGSLISIKEVKDGDHLMIINRSGVTIRIPVEDLRVLGRATQGVRLIDLRKNDQIAAVAKVDA